MLQHFRNPTLLATYAVGFGTLFNFVALFTYVNFVLAAPPFSLPPTLLGAIFATYLAGSLVLLWLGRAIARYGRRPFIICVLAVWACGAALTLVPSLWAIIGGLTDRGGVRLSHPGDLDRLRGGDGAERPHLRDRALCDELLRRRRLRRDLAGTAWDAGGWPACVAMVIAMQIMMATVVAFAWKR